MAVFVQPKMPLASPPGSDPGRALLIRCHECDLLQSIGTVPPDTSATCSRCGATLFAYKPHGFERAFILYLAALLLLVIANAFPFLTLKVQGQLQSSHLISGAIDLYLRAPRLPEGILRALTTSLLLRCAAPWKDHIREDVIDIVDILRSPLGF